ncbi:flavin-containing monooxygenase [Aquirhabdus sp.]|uniref:flavin-containing monooxygenase n=1 Tax=Aquirhabdus sp. TaxID=2824160 RepID=UPI00396C82D5
MSQQHFDILIVGAGISGIGVACHLSRECPKKSIAILERRQAIGGTWDLFRYPGIRSDSDMSTFGYHFKPWTESKVLADGESIRNYVNETAEEYGIKKKVHFGRQVKQASWSSKQKLWTLTVHNEATNKTEKWTANFLLGCTGYYNYDAGYSPEFPDQDKFKGQLIHPQHWPENLDYAGKRVVIIGSGATAITLVPSMAGTAGHVTMLQRSPTYIAAVPSIDFAYDAMKKVLPSKVAFGLTRARNIGLQRAIYRLSQKNPKAVRRLLLAAVKHQVGKDVDMRHFSPSYNPWDERLCVVPDGDLFKVLKNGSASIETDHIERFTETGILLKSGKTLDADIIVSATGLNVQMLGGTEVLVDGEKLNPNDHLMYQSIMVEGVPNAALIVGYTNASWTLKVDIAAEYLCRLINFMDKKDYKEVIARDLVGYQTEDTVMGSIHAGYIRRAASTLPRQGSQAPWIVLNNYLADRVTLRKSTFEDGILSFDGRVPKAKKGLFKFLGK